jgi:hypothetical protein
MCFKRRDTFTVYKQDKCFIHIFQVTDPTLYPTIILLTIRIRFRIFKMLWIRIKIRNSFRIDTRIIYGYHSGSVTWKLLKDPYANAKT